MTTTPTASSARAIRTAPFILGLLCFLLPFAEFSCQGQKFATVSGFQFAGGGTVDVIDPMTGQKKSQNIDCEKGVFCAMAFTFLAIFVAAFSRTRAARLRLAALGAAAFVSMLVAKQNLDSETLAHGQGIMVISYGVGFICACILQLGGAAIAVFYELPPKESA